MAQVNALLVSELGVFVVEHYRQAMFQAGLVDLADLQSLAIELLGHPPVLEKLRRRYAHMLVVTMGRLERWPRFLPHPSHFGILIQFSPLPLLRALSL